MNRIETSILSVLILAVWVYGQNGSKQYEKDDRGSALLKETAIEDRAGGTHNAGNIGLFFENRGKLYPRRLTQGPSGEFPINSGMHYIYRVNPMVGIPGNVVQGRYTTNEEWEAVAGYQNPAYTKIAFSDNPRTWHPDLGWPVKDSAGNSVIKSDQDSYCVYDDSKNGLEQLGLEVAQTGYAYGVKFAQNILFFKFELTNKGARDLDDVYFGLYCDCDIGDVSGGVAEYDDDFIGFDEERNLLYFYDDGNTSEWPGGKTGRMGFTFLRTPEVNGEEVGITGLHYNLYNDDLDRDSIQYAILSGDTSYLKPASLKEKYFHSGNNGNLDIDDPSTIPATGIDILATISSGPYRLNRGDTLVFYTAILAGTNQQNLLQAYDGAQTILDYNFEISKPPATPKLFAMGGDRRVTLFWDDLAEKSIDNFSGESDFEGYRIYKSADKGQHWDQFDRNIDPSVGVDPVPIAEFDLINSRGFDTGIQYSLVDSSVDNGFEYWYTITSYDRGDSTIESLECGRGSNTDAVNTVSITPESKAIDRIPVKSSSIIQVGKGRSNYHLNIEPVDQDSLEGNEYRIGFTYVSQIDQGRLKTEVAVIVYDSSLAGIRQYGIEFLSPTRLNLIDLSTGEYVGSNPKTYRSGVEYVLREGTQKVIGLKLTDPNPSATAADLPKNGDYISVRFGVYVTNAAGDTLVQPRAFFIGKPQSLTEGIIFKMTEPSVIQSVIRQSGSDDFSIDFSVGELASIIDNRYIISVEGNGNDPVRSEQFIKLFVRDSTGTLISEFDSLFNGDSFSFNGHSELKAYLSSIRVVPNPYMVGSLYEEEFGELRKEPIRKLKFINLPGQCTIKIFSIAGDLLKTLYHNELHGTETWNMRSEGGREIAAGIYIFVVEAGGEKYMNRFAVIK